MMGRAYAVLETDLPAGEALIRRVAAASGDISLAKALAEAFRSRGQVLADRVLTETLEKCKLMLRNHEREAAGELLQSVAGIVDYASPQLRTDWQRTQRKSAESGMLSRLRN